MQAAVSTDGLKQNTAPQFDLNEYMEQLVLYSNKEQSLFVSLILRLFFFFASETAQQKGQIFVRCEPAY